MKTFTKAQIKEISEQLDCGFRAFYHKQTGDLIFVPDTNKHIEIDITAWKEEFKKLDKNFFDFQEIFGMESSDFFRVMADFADQLTDLKLQNELIAALSRNKPFRAFKFIIENSCEHRQNWFDFKKERLIEWTEDQIKLQN